MIRRTWLGALPLAALLLGACGSVGGLFKQGPRTVEISQEKLLAQIAQEFPFNKRLLDLFDVSVSAPRLKMLPQENRVATELDLTAGENLLRRVFKGKLALTYGLKYEPSDNSIRLADVRVQKFEVDGVPEGLQSRFSRVGGLLAEEVLNGYVVHRLKPEDLKTAEGLGFKPGALNVTGTGLALTLEPIKR